MGKGRHARKKNGAAGTATRSDTSPSSAHILGEMVDNKEAALINMEAAPTTTEVDLTNTEDTPPWCVNQSSTTSTTWSRPLARTTVRSPSPTKRSRPATMGKVDTLANVWARPHTQVHNKTWSTPAA